MAGEKTPDWWKFEGEADYAAALVDLVADVRPEASAVYVDGIVGYLSTPIAAQAVSLGAAFEGATGISIGQLATLATSGAALATATEPNAIIGAAASLTVAGMGVATSAAKAAGVGMGALQTIPLISAFVEGVAAFASAIQASQDRVKDIQEHCFTTAEDLEIDFCTKLANATRPTPTGRRSADNHDGFDATDLFRPLAYEWRRPWPGRKDGRWRHRKYGSGAKPTEPGYLQPIKAPYLLGGLTDRGLAAEKHPHTYGMWAGERWVIDPRPAYPPSVASIFLGLCGGEPRFETRGPLVADIHGRYRLPYHFSPWTRAAGGPHPGKAYARWCDKNGVGPIPQPIQRQMWKAIRTLMLGARDPRPMGEKAAIVLEDGGRSAMALLIDLANGQRAAGRVPDTLLREIQYLVLDWTRHELDCERLAQGELAAHAPIVERWQCHQRFDLVTPFSSMLVDYDKQLPYYLDDLKNDPPPRPILKMPGAGLLAAQLGGSSSSASASSPAWLELRRGAELVGHLYAAPAAAQTVRAALEGDSPYILAGAKPVRRRS